MKTNCMMLIGLFVCIVALPVPGSAEEKKAQEEPQRSYPAVETARTELQRTDPDIVVYVPRGKDFYDTGNEHFNVFPSPSGKELLAVWTQCSFEGRGDNRAVIARSSDGVNWSEPQMIIGSPPGASGQQASWAFPVISRQGRIYLFYTKQVELDDGNPQGCGTMGVLYSDNEGRNWTVARDIPMPRNEFDHANPEVPKHWIVWQMPIRDRKGRLIVGYTQNTSRSRYDAAGVSWHGWSNRCQFMRFENLDEGPDPEDLKITWLPNDSKGLEVKHPNHDWSSAQEPALALLPDGRLFCVMRTWTGHIWYSVSDDDGATWRPTEKLLYKDDGEEIHHPLAPCPIYTLADGRYLLLFHNNTGKRGEYDQRQLKWKTNYLNFLRYPAYLAVGEFRPDAHQPIWFSPPREFADTGGVAIGPKGTSEVATYTSLTEWRGERILWYPDRKYFLLGKRINDNCFTDMKVPRP